jgi:hypothetical protein
MKALSRRSVTTGLAAAVAAVPGVGLSMAAKAATTERSELASLIDLYWRQVDAFNDTPFDNDVDFDVQALMTYEATRERMVGVPARTAEDAVAALDWLIRDECELSVLSEDGGCSEADGPIGDYHTLVLSLVNAIRDYIKSTVSA